MCTGACVTPILSTIGTVGAAAAGIGELFSAISPVLSLFGESDKPKVPTVPAAPAAAPRATGGADVKIGTDSRVSGPLTSRRATPKSTDVLSGLGRGGLSL